MPSLTIKAPRYTAIQRLPDEILLHVFSVCGLLSPLDHAHLAATCARFRRLAEDPVLWRDVSLKPYRSFTDDSTVRILVNTRFAAAEPGGLVRLQSLDMSKCSNVTDVAVGAVARGCPGLVRLDLSECVKITDWSLAELGKRCPRLQDLSVRLCADITDGGIAALLAGRTATPLPPGPLSPLSPLTPASPAGGDRRSPPSSPPPAVSLSRLDVSWCDRLTDAALEQIGSHCPNLTVLKISFAGRLVTDRGILGLLAGGNGDDEPVPGRGEHPLRVLEAAMCHSLTSLSLRALLDYAPHMEALVVTWCDEITSAAVSEFRRRRPLCSVLYNTPVGL